MNLERLNEAIDWLDHQPHAEAYTAAKELRAYADLLATGEEPDYEAAAKALYDHQHVLPTSGIQKHKAVTRAIVDAAIGGRLLINPPTEEE